MSGVNIAAVAPLAVNSAGVNRASTHGGSLETFEEAASFHNRGRVNSPNGDSRAQPPSRSEQEILDFSVIIESNSSPTDVTQRSGPAGRDIVQLGGG